MHCVVSMRNVICVYYVRCPCTNFYVEVPPHDMRITCMVIYLLYACACYNSLFRNVLSCLASFLKYARIPIYDPTH
jgi:hypothetical protein